MLIDIGPQVATANTSALEPTRSEGFKELRAEVASEIQALLALLQITEERHAPLKNGTIIKPGTSRTPGGMAVGGALKDRTPASGNAAYMLEKDGTTYFEMAEQHGDGTTRFVKIMADEAQAGKAIVRSSRRPVVVSSIYEETVSATGVNHFFGVDIMSDGAVVQHNFSELHQEPVSHSLTGESELEGLPEAVIGIGDELL